MNAPTAGLGALDGFGTTMTRRFAHLLRRGAHAGGELLTERLGGKARRRAIVILACVLGLHSADTGAIGALAPQLEKAFHIGNLEIGLLVTVSSLVGAMATLPVGVLADRRSRTGLLTASIVVWGIAEAVSGLSVSYLMLLLTRLFLGLISATAGPTVGSLTGDLFPARERGRIYGYILTGELLGSGLGLVVSGDIGAAVSWRLGFFLLAIPSLALAYVIHRRLPEPARGGQSWLEEGDERIIPASEVTEETLGPTARESGPPLVPSGARTPGETTNPSGARTPSDAESGAGRKDGVLAQVAAAGIEAKEEIVLGGDSDELSLWQALRWVVRVRTNVYLIVSSCLGYFFFAGLTTFAVLFARGQFHITQEIATLLALVVGLAAIVGLLSSGRLADRLLRKGRLNARLVVAAGGYFIAAVFLVPALSTRNLAIALPFLMVGTAAVAAPNSPVDAARLDVVPARMWGRTEAIRTFLRTILEAFAPLLFGAVSELFGARSSGFGAGVNASTSKISAASAQGLSDTFLVMLVPLALSGVFLLIARKNYPTDVASAGESERRFEESAGTSAKVA